MLGKGDKQLNLGVGLSSWGIPLYGGMDFGVHRDISVGGELTYRTYKEKWFKDTYYSHSIIGIAGNGNYHFNTLLSLPRKFDLYAGLNLGFFIWSSPKDYPGSGTGGLDAGIQIGFRYYFNNKIGINLEAGSGNAFSGGKVGVTIVL